MKLIAYLVICIDFVSLPIAYSKSVLIFLIMLLISVAVVFNSQDTVEERCFKLYLWSISFFGISISGIKIFKFRSSWPSCLIYDVALRL